MKKSVLIVSHIFLWLTIAIFMSVFCFVFLKANPGAPYAGHAYKMVGAGLFVIGVFFYATYFLIPWAVKNRRNLIISASVLLLLLLSFSYNDFRWGIFAVLRSVFPVLSVVFFAYIFRKYSDSLKLEEEKRDLILKNTQSELALLKHQINPHFFFNTLNNVDYLINEDTQKASLALNKLSEIMRYMIYEADKEKVPLTKEVSYIESYISLQRLRITSDNQISFRITGETGNINIPPMLFITFIENAFKHSSFKKDNNVVDITLNIGQSEIKFSCINNLASFSSEKDHAGGIGLDLIRKRLNLIYPDAHELKINKTEQRFEVFLKIKTNAD
jgi:sensor histidine kinase YesM